MSLLIMGIQVTFLKIWVVFYILCISTYGIAQQANKENDRDEVEKSISFLVLLLVITFFVSVAFACLLEYHTMTTIPAP